MKDLIANVVLLIYLGVVFLHKLLGYSYFTAAWRSMVFLIAFGLLLALIVVGYRHIVSEATDTSETEESQSESMSTSAKQA